MSHQELTLIVRILAKPEKREFVKNELQKLITVTRTEEGCINYDLHQDNKNENLFFMYEKWENSELLQKHSESLHLAAYIKATEGAVEEFIVNQVSKIES